MHPRSGSAHLFLRERAEALSREARSRPRLRLNLNLHAMEDPVHRLFNAVEPGTYIRPHRHLDPPRTETVVVVAGRVGLLVFDAGGDVLEHAVLEPGGQIFGAEIPAGTWHTFVALESGGVFLEVKEGPYVSPGRGDVATWAPPEGDPSAAETETRLRTIFLDREKSFTST